MRSLPSVSRASRWPQERGVSSYKAVMIHCLILLLQDGMWSTCVGDGMWPIRMHQSRLDLAVWLWLSTVDIKQGQTWIRWSSSGNASIYYSEPSRRLHLDAFFSMLCRERHCCDSLLLARSHRGSLLAPVKICYITAWFKSHTLPPFFLSLIFSHSLSCLTGLWSPEAGGDLMGSQFVPQRTEQPLGPPFHFHNIL